jgi:hypothetical protein
MNSFHYLAYLSLETFFLGLGPAGVIVILRHRLSTKRLRLFSTRCCT